MLELGGTRQNKKICILLKKDSLYVLLKKNPFLDGNILLKGSTEEKLNTFF